MLSQCIVDQFPIVNTSSKTKGSYLSGIYLFNFEKRQRNVYISVYNVYNVYTEHGTITLNNLYLTHQIGPSYNISNPDMMCIDFTDM